MERRAHAAADLAGLSWEQLADKLDGRSTDTLTRRLREIDGGREVFPYESAEALLRRITVFCKVGPDFFKMDFGKPKVTDSETGDAKGVPSSLPPGQGRRRAAQDDPEPG